MIPTCNFLNGYSGLFLASAIVLGRIQVVNVNVLIQLIQFGSGIYLTSYHLRSLVSEAVISDKLTGVVIFTTNLTPPMIFRSAGTMFRPLIPSRIPSLLSPHCVRQSIITQAKRYPTNQTAFLHLDRSLLRERPIPRPTRGPQ